MSFTTLRAQLNMIFNETMQDMSARYGEKKSPLLKPVVETGVVILPKAKDSRDTGRKYIVKNNHQFVNRRMGCKH